VEAEGKGRSSFPIRGDLDRDDVLDQMDKDQEIFKEPIDGHPERGGTGRRLKGPYADTTGTPNCAPVDRFPVRLQPRDNRFEEVMAYHHIDALQRYLSSWFKDGKGILNRSIKVNATVEKKTTPTMIRLRQARYTYGDGGVDDAEDADVIIHEYATRSRMPSSPGSAREKRVGPWERVRGLPGRDVLLQVQKGGQKIQGGRMGRQRYEGALRMPEASRQQEALP